MPPVEDHPVHEKVRVSAGRQYGCNGKPRPDTERAVTDGGASWPYVFSTECRYDLSLTDTACEGCQWRGSGEEYDRRTRAAGK